MKYVCTIFNECNIRKKLMKNIIIELFKFIIDTYNLSANVSSSIVKFFFETND